MTYHRLFWAFRVKGLCILIGLLHFQFLTAVLKLVSGAGRALLLFGVGLPRGD